MCVPGAGNTVNCTGATLSGTVNAAGTNPTTRTIVLRAFSSAIPGNYVNTAIVDPLNAIPEGNETNNMDVEPTTVSNGGPGPFIDLQIDKTQLVPENDGPVTPGAPLAYEIEVSNVGAATAFNVTVEDVLPTPSTYFTAFDANPGPGNFTCAQASGVVTCTGGTIQPGAPRTIRVFLIAPTNIEDFEGGSLDDISITITNQAFVDPDNAIAEGDETNNADSEDTVVSSFIDLTLTKEGPGSVTQNETITYTITVTNNKIGPGATAFNVKIVDPLPVGLIPLDISAEDGNFSCQLEENPVNTVTCVGDLESEDHVTITILAFVTNGSGTIDNEACVDPDEIIDETNELNNCKHALGEVTPLKPDLQITKSADSSVANLGQELTYTVTVSNVGNTETADAITMTDILPADVTLVSPGGVTAAGGLDLQRNDDHHVRQGRRWHDPGRERPVHDPSDRRQHGGRDDQERGLRHRGHQRIDHAQQLDEPHDVDRRLGCRPHHLEHRGRARPGQRPAERAHLHDHRPEQRSGRRHRRRDPDRPAR